MKRTMTLLTIAALALCTTTTAQAATLVNTDFDIVALGVGGPCTGELIDLEGTVHVTFGVTVNANTLHIKGHLNFAGVKGVGQTTSAQYVGNGVANFNLNLAKGGNITVVAHFRLIGQGDLADGYIKALFHLTANADGAVTAAFLNFEADCN